MAVIGLLMASYGACPNEAHAEKFMHSKGWHVTATDDKGKVRRDETLVVTEFCQDRAQVDLANTNARMVRTLTGDVAALRVELIEATKPEPGWKIGVRWAGWGISVGAAFILGVML